MFIGDFMKKINKKKFNVSKFVIILLIITMIAFYVVDILRGM